MPEFLVLAALIAVIDWVAVLTDRTRVEEIAKPLVPLALIAWVLTAGEVQTASAGRLVAVDQSPPADPTAWVVTGLVLGLVGDVLLLPRVNQFVAGLAAFLVGHLAYLPPLVARRDDAAPLPLILLLLGGAVLLVGTRIVRGARDKDGWALAGPVVAYVGVVAAVAATAVATLRVPVAVGGVLFAASDATIGWTRFVSGETTPASRTFIHVTYHLAQVGLASMVVGALR